MRVQSGWWGKTHEKSELQRHLASQVHRVEMGVTQARLPRPPADHGLADGSPQRLYCLCSAQPPCPQEREPPAHPVHFGERFKANVWGMCSVARAPRGVLNRLQPLPAPEFGFSGTRQTGAPALAGL